MSALSVFTDPSSVEALRRMSEREIRRAQASAQAQITLAHAQGNGDALVWLQRADDEYAAELRRRLDERS